MALKQGLVQRRYRHPETRDRSAAGLPYPMPTVSVEAHFHLRQDDFS
jgi:hypothetical protein